MSRMFEMLRQAQRDQALLKHSSSPNQSNSQNFEVLQLSGKDGPLFEAAEHPAALNPMLVPPPPGGILRGEIFKLVQQLFLAQDCPRPRVLVFCAVEHGGQRGWIGPKVAEQLASHALGTVCVVDADVTSPSLHTYFEIKNEHGFLTALSHPDPIKNFAEPIGHDGLWVMPAGAPLPDEDSKQLLTFESLRARLTELRASFDHVLVDAPLATSESVAAYLGSLADGVILVVEQSFTPRQAVRELKEEIEAAGGRVLGVVLHRRELSLLNRTNSRRQALMRNTSR